MIFSKQKLFITLILIQSVLVIIYYVQIPDNDQLALLEKKISELKFQNKETKNLLLSIKSNSKPVYPIEKYNILEINETSEKKNNLSQEKIKSLIEDEVESILSEKLAVFRKNILNEISITSPALAVGIQSQVINNNKKYIDKQYDSIDDDYFKSNLTLVDEIIERAINAGEFTEWDAEELNNAAIDLNFDKKVFIMNKLSHAYNSQKIKGKFINFNLVNRSSEN